MAEMTIKRFGVFSVAKIYGLICFIFGLIIGVIYGLFLIIFWRRHVGDSAGRKQ